GQVDALDLRREIDVGAARLGLYGGRDVRLPAAHEPASDAGDGRPLAPLVAQMLERDVRVREDDPVRGAGRLVHESEGALEDVELDLFQLDRGLDPDVGLREEVRVSVDPQAPPFEDRGGEMKLGRVDALWRADVADVLGAELKRAEVQGLEGAAIHVGDVAIANAQAVDLEIEGQRLQRLLPSLLLQRHIALCLGADLSEIHVDGRAIERDVG